MMQVCCFGKFRLQDPEGNEISIAARSAAELIALLVIRRGRKIPRAELAETLWPGHPGERARVNLRKAIQRARGALPALVVEGDNVWVESSRIRTDFQELEHYHRSYSSAPETSDGLEALRSEWMLARQTLLSNWDAAWIEPFRTRYRLYADEIGAELAETHESHGDLESALEVWRAVLTDSPDHVEAIENILRIEAEIGGIEHALAVFHELDPCLWSTQESAMPKSLKKLVGAIRSGTPLAHSRTEHFRSKSQWRLLAQIMESNLNRGRDEGIRLLASEANSALTTQYPRVMLSLFHTALLAHGRVTTDTLLLASQTITLASLCTEFDVGHLWADWILANSQEREPIYVDALAMKGFMHLEQRQWVLARTEMESASRLAQKNRNVPGWLRSEIRLAGLNWQSGRYEEARQAYESVMERASTNEDWWIQGLAATVNLAFLHAILGNWAEAHRLMHLTQGQRRDTQYDRIGLVPSGAAEIIVGDRKQGIQQLLSALASTQEQGMRRFNQLALDFACVGLVRMGDTECIEMLLDGITMHRHALSHDRSPAEAEMIRREIGFVDWGRSTPNPWRSQPLNALNSYVADRLRNHL